MEKLYKIRLKIGDEEIEVESTDRKYVDSKIKEFKNATATAIEKPNKKITKKTLKKKNIVGKFSPDKTKNSEISQEELIAEITNFIKESDLYNKIEENVLDKRPRINKILLCYYFAEDAVEDPYLTSGQASKITDQLSIKIGQPNVSTIIKKYSKYFSQDKSRTPGAIVKYKLNRHGKQEFERILKGNKS